MPNITYFRYIDLLPIDLLPISDIADTICQILPILVP